MGRTKKSKQEKGMQLNELQVAALAIAFKRHGVTIRRWAQKNHSILALPAAQQIIKQYESLSQNIQTINN
jgi:hypothetical protein